MQGQQLKLDYFHGNEPDNFCFYRIPKVLFTKAVFQDLSTDAKVLYGLMLDLMSSSRTNRWIDNENRVFIQFSIQRAMAYLGCGKAKAVKLFAELDTEKGIGLIERVGRGQGKADIIYVKSFEVPREAEDSARIVQIRKRRHDETFGPTVQKSLEEEEELEYTDMAFEATVQKSVEEKEEPERTDMTFGPAVQRSGNSGEGMSREPKICGKADRQEVVRFSNHLYPEIHDSALKVVRKSNRSENRTGTKSEPLEVRYSNPNKNNYINTEDTDKEIYIPSFSPSCQSGKDAGHGHRQAGNDGGHDRKEVYIHLLQDQVNYSELMKDRYYCLHQEMIDGIINMIADIAVYPKPSGTERINGREVDYITVRDRLMKLDEETLRYVIECLGENCTKIRNKRAYLLTALYNAPDEIDFGYSAMARYDLYGGG